MYVYQDFSKADKKLLEPLLKLAVQREIEHFTKKTLPLHKALVENEHKDIRTPFWEMMDQFSDFRKRITGIYDGYRHRDIPLILTNAVLNDDLKMEDFIRFSPAGKQKIEEIIISIQQLRGE